MASSSSTSTGDVKNDIGSSIAIREKTSCDLVEANDQATDYTSPISFCPTAQLDKTASLFSNQMLALDSSSMDTSRAPFGPTDKKQNRTERLQRSRERNRMHARKTRQRKKEHMHKLQDHAEDLKKEQLKLRQTINEKTTANILLGLFFTADEKQRHLENDPKVEKLMQRPIQEIPGPSRIPELPALILPGQHNSKKNRAIALETNSDQQETPPDDGIDYDLLGKNRSTCSPAELDQIRRERNRMHAKRTRDRKRLYMEEMEEMTKRLLYENELLSRHINNFDAESEVSSGSSTPLLTSPSTKPSPTALLDMPLTAAINDAAIEEKDYGTDQIKTLLEAAGAFNKRNANTMGMFAISSVASTVSTSHSTEVSVTDDLHETMSHRSSPCHSSTTPQKKQRREDTASSAPRIVSSFPTSITTVEC